MPWGEVDNNFIKYVTQKVTEHAAFAAMPHAPKRCCASCLYRENPIASHPTH